jgi:hypothetical protein
MAGSSSRRDGLRVLSEDDWQLIVTATSAWKDFAEEMCGIYLSTSGPRSAPYRGARRMVRLAEEVLRTLGTDRRPERGTG